jgi:hypothetical protein
MMQWLQVFAAGCNTGNFFGIPPWYKYLVISGRMTVNSTTGVCELVGNFQWRGGGDVVLVGLALVDMALRVAGMVAVGFVIWGGIQYLTSDGSPDQTKSAQQTIINALIGLVIALIAAAAVSFIGRAITK